MYSIWTHQDRDRMRPVLLRSYFHIQCIFVVFSPTSSVLLILFPNRAPAPS
ncbi:hypothetical protein BDV25DRAFT_30184 [Aspergillus avenaceus]|uniref:Uncharacterized protein n=1 Tax=Aspergillus avenaceus TaxID=36643 RepID=A0A5N6TMS6_ASPAV|nr:hypothetical protein BDV25DRAFT_30184 [Aspergillus avenaceus]